MKLSSRRRAPPKPICTLLIGYSIGGNFVPAIGVGGQPTCLVTGSTDVPDTIHTTAGSFDLGVYDFETASDRTMLLGSTHLEVAAGAEELVVVYHSGSMIQFLSAPIQAP